MKTCPRCAEKVQPSARICRYCAYEFAADETLEAEHEAMLAKAAKALPALLFGGFLLWTCSGVQKQMTADRAQEIAQAQASVHDPKPCRKLLRKAQRAGLVRAWRRGDEIEVDEWLWAAMPADAKRGILLGLRCAALAGRPDAGELPLVVTASGWRTGREVGRASRYGVTLE